MNVSTCLSTLWLISSSYLGILLVSLFLKFTYIGVNKAAELRILSECSLNSLEVIILLSTKALFLLDLSLVKSLHSLKADSKNWYATGNDSFIGTSVLSSMLILRYSISKSARKNLV